MRQMSVRPTGAAGESLFLDEEIRITEWGETQPPWGQDKLTAEYTQCHLKASKTSVFMGDRQASQEGAGESKAMRPELWVLVPALPPFSLEFGSQSSL